MRSTVYGSLWSAVFGWFRSSHIPVSSSFLSGPMICQSVSCPWTFSNQVFRYHYPCWCCRSVSYANNFLSLNKSLVQWILQSRSKVDKVLSHGRPHRRAHGFVGMIRNSGRALWFSLEKIVFSSQYTLCALALNWENWALLWSRIDSVFRSHVFFRTRL